MAKVDALSTLLPRITPVIHANDVKQMDAADLMDIGLEVADFYQSEVHSQGSRRRRYPNRVEDYGRYRLGWSPDVMYDMTIDVSRMARTSPYP